MNFEDCCVVDVTRLYLDSLQVWLPAQDQASKVIRHSTRQHLLERQGGGDMLEMSPGNVKWVWV